MKSKATSRRDANLNKKRQENKELTETVETEKSDTDRLINIKTKIGHLTDRRNYITMTMKNDGTEKQFIDTGSPVRIIPMDKEVIEGKKILPVIKKYEDVNKNELKFAGKITVEAESKGIRKNLSMLITEREDMHWLREFNWTIGLIEKSTTPTDQAKSDEIITQFEKLFKRYQTIKDTANKTQIKSGHLPEKTDG